ncbi:DUF4397 domain-containing protein [Sutcliffiella horikoshii]|uniref:DUF4397 domain-containing protein n=1 Tax=Sutcliffiella horikoshii TaxID=79883 RepID=A0A5D4SIU3_9BACI|nr:DUF4397 domain-containing protein [Sutcliffiella horikoshii]TYS63587.1 DUF4397 domain-containing protein [Sutcliffiella horikoshii]
MGHDENYFLAGQYQLLADYYKYSDSQKHIYFYSMHIYHLQKWVSTMKPVPTREAPSNNRSQLRILHAAPGIMAVDVLVNNNPVWKDLRYTNSSRYVDIKPTNNQIEVIQNGQKLITGTLQANTDMNYTIAIAGTKDKLQLIPIVDDSTVPQSESKLRFWHLSPDAPSVDIAVKKGDIVFSDIAYGGISDYLGLTPMTVDLEIRVAGTKDIVLHLNRVSLKPDVAYTIVAVGLVKNSPSLEAIFLAP